MAEVGCVDSRWLWTALVFLTCYGVLHGQVTAASLYTGNSRLSSESPSAPVTPNNHSAYRRDVDVCVEGSVTR